MSDLRLMIVEDDNEAVDICQSCVNDFNQDKGCSIELVKCITLEDALLKLNMSFDGVIIDIKLDTHGAGDEGNRILERISEEKNRVPIAILTGTPDTVELKPNYIGVFKKGEQGAGYTDLLNHFWEIYNTGLTRIMGGRGKLEESLERIFNENLMPEPFRNKWIEYGTQDASRTEKALLRHALSYLFELLDEDECYLPEEVYLIPPVSSDIKTGSIVKNETDDQYFVVMSPACDLIIRSNGVCKTDRILVVEIDKYESVFPDHSVKTINSKQRKELEGAFKNNKSSYYHWLPRTDFFHGGFINFRKVFSYTIDEFKEKHGGPVMQISTPFVKDIVARFSSYYSRQGQPEVDYRQFLNPIESESV